MDFSFIIPARNEGEAIRETISHLSRSCRRFSFEILLIDDCSDEPLLDGFTPPPELTFHRCGKRQGIAKARNVGASMARGSVLIFLDAHVCFSSGWLDQIMRTGVGENQKIVGTATRILSNFGQFRGFARRVRNPIPDRSQQYFGWLLKLRPELQLLPNRLRLPGQSFAVPYVGASTLAIGRDLFRELGEFEHELTGYGNLEDAELAMRCWAFGYQVHVVPSAVCLHYTDPKRNRMKRAMQGRHSLDHVQYDGTIENAIRVMHLHFPTDVIDDILTTCFNDPSLNLTAEYVAAVVDERINSRVAWIERHRKRDRRWLMERFETV